MKKISRVIIMGIFFFLLTSCYKEESYESKREPTEIVEVIPEKEEAAVTEKVTSEQVNLRAEASVDSAVLFSSCKRYSCRSTKYGECRRCQLVKNYYREFGGVYSKPIYYR